MELGDPGVAPGRVPHAGAACRDDLDGVAVSADRVDERRPLVRRRGGARAPAIRVLLERDVALVAVDAAQP